MSACPPFSLLKWWDVCVLCSEAELSRIFLKTIFWEVLTITVEKTMIIKQIRKTHSEVLVKIDQEDQ